MYPGSPIEAGSSNEAAVRQIQTRLKTLGVDPALDVDGDFGPSTEAAVKLFQARALDANGDLLLIDGVVGPTTWAALFGEKIEKVKSAGGALLEAVVAKAKSQVGVLESPLGSNRGPEVDEYLRRAGLNPKAGSYAWCAAFVYWCFDEAAKDVGKPNPAPKTAGVLEMWRRAGAASLRRYTPAQAKADPALVKPGQLFFLDTGSGTGHVGLIIGVEGMALTTVEGNTTEITGSREGIGVFKRKARRIGAVNLGFADFSQTI
jgi:cell wall-associated NlpC family hydrolase